MLAPQAGMFPPVTQADASTLVVWVKKRSETNRQPDEALLTLLGREIRHYFHQPWPMSCSFLLLTAANFHAGLSP